MFQGDVCSHAFLCLVFLVDGLLSLPFFIYRLFLSCIFTFQTNGTSYQVKSIQTIRVGSAVGSIYANRLLTRVSGTFQGVVCGNVVFFRVRTLFCLVMFRLATTFFCLFGNQELLGLVWKFLQSGFFLLVLLCANLQKIIKKKMKVRGVHP